MVSRSLHFIPWENSSIEQSRLPGNHSATLNLLGEDNSYTNSRRVNWTNVVRTHLAKVRPGNKRILAQNIFVTRESFYPRCHGAPPSVGSYTEVV